MGSPWGCCIWALSTGNRRPSVCPEPGSLGNGSPLLQGAPQRSPSHPAAGRQGGGGEKLTWGTRRRDPGCCLVPTAPGEGEGAPTRWLHPRAQASPKPTRCSDAREPRRARMRPEPTAVHNSGVYSYSTLGKQRTEFLRPERLVLLSGAKFLLLDGQRQLGLDVHDGPLHHHEAVLVQQIGEEQGLRGRR